MAVSPLLEHSDSYLIDSRLSKDTGLASRQKAHEAKAAPFRLRLFSFVQHGSVLRLAVWGGRATSRRSYPGTPTSHGLPPLIGVNGGRFQTC